MDLFSKTRNTMREAEKDKHRQQLVSHYDMIERHKNLLITHVKYLDGVLEEIKADVNSEALEPARVEFWNKWWFTEYVKTKGNFFGDTITNLYKSGRC